MARLAPFTFHVPASTANLGPGYGVLAVALDLPLEVTVTPRTDGEVLVEREDEGWLEEDDPRHDPVVRGLRAGLEMLQTAPGRGVHVHVQGVVPRGTGLGTISAGYAAGLAAAVRIARRLDVPADTVLSRLITLGGDPAHGAASLCGGFVSTVPLGGAQDHPRRLSILRWPLDPDWRFLVLMPQADVGLADTRRVLPPTLPHAVTPRSTGRVLGLLQALQHGDEELLRDCLHDDVHVPYRRRLVPGMDAALAAGLAAGAAGTTICGHGPALLALTTDGARTDAIANAMIDAFADAGRKATALVLRAAHYGALPVLPA